MSKLKRMVCIGGLQEARIPLITQKSAAKNEAETFKETTLAMFQRASEDTVAKTWSAPPWRKMPTG
jgi:hypothetical protein